MRFRKSSANLWISRELSLHGGFNDQYCLILHVRIYYKTRFSNSEKGIASIFYKNLLLIISRDKS